MATRLTGESMEAAREVVDVRFDMASFAFISEQIPDVDGPELFDTLAQIYAVDPRQLVA